MPIPDFVHDDLEQLGFEAPAPLLALLEHYLELLLQANERMNLTAVREPDAAWRRLIVDSMTPLPWLDELPEDAQVTDVGSGGGLPGVPLAICRGDLQFTLIEATAKKAEFLGEIAGTLGLEHVQVVNDRAERVGHMPEHRARYDVAVSRAVGALPAVLEWSMPLIREGGFVLAMKGPKIEQDLDDSAAALQVLGAGEVEVYDAYPESFGNDLVIARITKDRPTPKQYPRDPGMAKKSPL